VASRHGCFVDDRALALDYDGLDLRAECLEALDPMFKVGI
jgi:hypothetical protein